VERVLLALPEQGAIQIYLSILGRQDPDRPIVWHRAVAATRALLKINGPAVANTITQRLAHPDLRTRIFSARVLQLIGKDLTPRLDSRIVPDVLEAWSEGSGAVRAAGEALAYGLGAPAARIALPLFLKGAGKGAQEEISSWIIRALGKQPSSGQEGVLLLVQALESPPLTTAPQKALLHAFPALGEKAPRAFLRDTLLRELHEARKAVSQGRADTRGKVRADLLLALDRTTPFSGWKQILQLALEDPSVLVRRRAAREWIRRSGDKTGYHHLIKILIAHRSDHFGRSFYHWTARQGNDAAFSHLQALAQGKYTKKAKIRLTALNALTSVLWSEDKEKRLALWMRKRYAAEGDPLARSRILHLLFNLEKAGALDLLQKVALDRSERVEVRIKAVNRLGISGVPEAAAALRKIVTFATHGLKSKKKSEVLRLQAVACRALCALALPEDREMMLNLIESGPERPRRLALGALEKIRDPSTRKRVEAMTRNGLVEPENRARGLRVLAAIGGKGTADHLLKRLREENLPEIRLGALDALSLLKPEEYVDRLIHYLTVLKEGRSQDPTSWSLFAEFLGELGKIKSRVVTRFLIDFLLEDQLGPDARLSHGKRPPPLEVAARAALLDHGPDLVRSILNRRIQEISREGPGLGIREEFYHDMLRLFSHPTRLDAWGGLAEDLGRHVLRTPPHASKLDFRSLQLQADQAFDRGDYATASKAFQELHRLAIFEGFLDKESAETSLADDPIGRQAGLAMIARALSLDKARKADSLDIIKQSISAASSDAQTHVTAAHATACLGIGLSWALACLDKLGPRGRDSVASAMARYDLSLALLKAGRKDEGRSVLEIACQDHAPLRGLAREEPVLREAFTPAELESLLKSAGNQEDY